MKIKQKIISLLTASAIAFSGLLSSGSFAAVDTGPDDGVDNSIPFTETSHDEESDCDNHEIINGSSVTLKWPVPGFENKIFNPYKGEGIHDGIDIAASGISGANVVAAYGGTVYMVYKCTHINCYPGCLYNTCDGKDCDGFGTGVIIRGYDGRYYQYAHMVPGSIPSDIYKGATVAKGQVVGKVGNSGAAKGIHLHFQINTLDGWYGSVDPANENYDSIHVHDYWLQTSSRPNCTSDGYEKYVCSCGDSYKVTLPALGHNDEVSYIKPTLTQAGNVKYTCTRCGRSYLGDEIPAPQKKEDGWYYCDMLPDEVTADKYDIQYDNLYTVVQENSPGDEWIRCTVQSREWVNTGEPYNSWYELEVSDSRVLIDSYYYHYCSASTGMYSNYEPTSTYVHGDKLALDLVNIDATYLDDDDITYYSLSWKSNGTKAYCCSGVTCDSSYGTHGQRSYYWYKMNWYQDRYEVVKYLYAKDTGWVDYKDSNATSTTCRFKYKNTAPANVKATPGDGKVTITWDEVDGATNYAVFLRKGTEWLKIGSSGTNTTFTSRGLANGGKYFYMVKAYVNGSWSDESAVVSATPVCITPQNVKASAGDGKVTLTWDAVPGASNYAVFLRKGTTWLKIGASGAGTTFTSRGLTNGGKYFYMVKAYVNGSWSDESAIVSATPVCITPQNVKAVGGYGKATITWNAVSGASNYVVMMKKGTSWVTLSSTGTKTSYTATGLTSGGKYYFVVKAYVNGAWSDMSETVAASIS